jgi:hypothetical protein
MELEMMAEFLSLTLLSQPLLQGVFTRPRLQADLSSGFTLRVLINHLVLRGTFARERRLQA